MLLACHRHRLPVGQPHSGGGDFFLEEREAGVAEVLGLSPLDERDHGVASPLLEAVKNGRAETVRALLKQHANANVAEADGTSALHLAVRDRNTAVAEALIRAGANVKAANRYGVTALSLAATNGDAAMMAALLKAGADANTAMPDGETCGSWFCNRELPYMDRILDRADALVICRAPYTRDIDQLIARARASFVLSCSFSRSTRAPSLSRNRIVNRGRAATRSAPPTARPPLRHTMPTLCHQHSRTPPRRAQNFPSATSLRIRMSSSFSATNRFNPAHLRQAPNHSVRS